MAPPASTEPLAATLPSGVVLRIPGMRRMLLCLLVLALTGLVPAVAQADRPSARTLYADGPSGRFLLDGPWLFRLDPGDTGINDGLPSATSTDGWNRTSVPNAWNVGDDSPASMAGGIGWYRKDFELPDAHRALQWVIRFESVNYRATVWLNGREIGAHAGAYLPFEFTLSGLRPKGTRLASSPWTRSSISAPTTSTRWSPRRKRRRSSA